MDVFKKGDVVKQMFQKGYKISFRIFVMQNFQELMWKIEFMGSTLEFTFLNSLFHYVSACAYTVLD